MAKYSIIMPVYNSEATLHKSVDSVINQTFGDWELIIVDDGSTDNTSAIIQKYEKKDSRIKSFFQKNSGPGAARNLGIKNSSGDYIAFIDSDDYYESDFLNVVNDFLKKSNFDLVFISSINELKNGKILYIDNLTKFRNNTKKELLSLQIVGKFPWGPCSKVVKSEIVKKCSFSNLSVGEESIYSFDVLNSARCWEFIEKPMYHYVHNESGQHKKGGLDPWRKVITNLKEHLNSLNLFNEYEYAYNSLVVSAMLISIYRNSAQNSFGKALKNVKSIIKEYFTMFDMSKVDISLLSNSSKILFILVKLKLYLILVLLSKVRAHVYD